MTEPIDIPELKQPLIDKDDIEEGKNVFYIDKFLGRGGSGKVYRAKVMEQDDKLGLNLGMNVAIKICDPDLTYTGCLEYKKEAKLTNIFSSLNYNNICYNFPIVYGFFNSCIFFTKSQSEFIIGYMKKNNINICRDAFIIYCCTPENFDIDQDIVEILLENYSPQILKQSRDLLPKTQNAKGLYLISLSLGDRDWKKNQETYDYLFSLPDLEGCDMYILLQYLKGYTLTDLKKNDKEFKFPDNIFFESVYSTVSSVFFIHNIHTDRQSENAMIVNTINPRIYLYKNKYYIIEGDTFYWIDINRLSSNYEINTLSKYDIKFFNCFTEEQQQLINHIFSEENPSAEKILDLLFGWLSTKVSVLNKEEVTRYMVINYNYRLCLVDKLI